MNDLPRMTVIDVGAFGGAACEWARIGHAVELIGFEADAEECRRLQNVPAPVADIRLHPFVIAGREGPVDFYLTQRPTCSSTLHPLVETFQNYGMPGSARADRARVREKTTLQATTLDRFCAEQDIQPDFVKLDTQGSELEILAEGFTKGVGHCLGLEIEVEFIPLYEGQALFSEVEQFVRSRGFGLFGLKRNMWKMNDGRSVPPEHGGRLIWADALFLNEHLFTPGMAEPDAIKGVLLCHRYRLADVASHIAAVQGLDADFLAELLVRADMSPTTTWWQRVCRRLSGKRERHPDRGHIVDFDDEYGF